jgi:hypothetical protein
MSGEVSSPYYPVLERNLSPYALPAEPEGRSVRSHALPSAPIAEDTFRSPAGHDRTARP